MSKINVFGVAGDTAMSFLLLAVAFGMGYQALASDVFHQSKVDTLLLDKQEIHATQIAVMQVRNAEIRSDVRSNKESLKRIEKQNGEILKFLRGDVYRVRDNG